jgi:hypothetical protein
MREPSAHGPVSAPRRRPPTYACAVSVPVPLDELAAALDRRANLAYRLTVGEDGRAHCVASRVDWLDDELVVSAGKTSLRNAAARGHVVLLSPPPAGLAAPAPDDEGYSLIIDAEVTSTSSGEPTGEAGVRARPTHAVLHRPAVAPDGRHRHDCVPVYDEV